MTKVKIARELGEILEAHVVYIFEKVSNRLSRDLEFYEMLKRIEEDISYKG